MLRDYYYLTKPGIIRGNLMIAGSSYIFASQGMIRLTSFLGLIIGMSLVIGSACVFNNIIDRGIDAKMARTTNRALAAGRVGITSALLYGIILGLIGFAMLIVFVNWLTFIIGLAGMIAYVVIYGYFKRRTIYGTLIGSISGSMPPIAGYTSAVNHMDISALFLFIILTAWQMAHFYSIGIYRLSDYKTAGLPIFTVIKGKQAAKRHILAWIVVYTVLCAGLHLFIGSAGLMFMVITAGFGLLWFIYGLKSYNDDADKWSRTMFGWSLLGLLSLSLALVLNPWLP